MKNLLIKFFLFTILISTTLLSISATVRTSPASGSANWGSVSWTTTGSGTPVTYVIQSGYTITINTSTTLGTGDSVKVQGTLTFDNGNKDLTIPGSTAFVQVANGGSISGGNSSNQFNIGSSTTSGTFNITGPAYSTSTGFTSGDALPVTWGYVNGQSQNGLNLLTWSTASELNNSHFEIERAGNDGVFTQIGQVAGNGTTFEMQEYTFTDNTPLNGANYYRIRQVDFNGMFDYSTMIDLLNTQTPAIKLFPTLIHSLSENIHLENIATGSEVTILDPLGRIIRQFTYFGESDARYSFDLQNSFGAKGMYSILVSNTLEKNFLKILVQ